MSYHLIGSAQNTNTIIIEFDGLSPSHYSPYIFQEPANHGIQNPERGYEVKGGVIDLFANDYLPVSGLDHNYMQYLQKGDAYSENVIEGDVSNGRLPIQDYLRNVYCQDGISLVEIEEYVNFTHNNLTNQSPVRNQDKVNATSVFASLPIWGVKAHLVMNSSYQIFHGNPGDLPSNYVQGMEFNDVTHEVNKFPSGERTQGLSFYLDEMAEHYQEISPFVANVHLGWVYAPHDRNTYRHSGKWQKSNWLNAALYPIGNEIPDEMALGGPVTNPALIKNESGDFRESKQRFDWNIAHGIADGWDYTTRINKIRGLVLDKVLNAFPHQKVLLNSMYPWTNYLGLKKGLSSMPGNTTAYDDFYSGTNAGGHPYWSELLTNDQKQQQRVGYYDGFFGGDTYSHAWSIGNGETQMIHWHDNYYASIPALGVDWVDNKMNVDSYLLRKYRENLWVHGELPTFETAYTNDCGASGPIGDGINHSFTMKYNSFLNWLHTCGAPTPVQYAWEMAERMSNGDLQDGFYSALKMRYFNFTSFNIGHNHLLDGRTPYELTDNQSSTWYGSQYQNYPAVLHPNSGVPKKQNTAVSRWKGMSASLHQNLLDFQMPVSENYFGTNNNEVRSTYEYIRDHLGYRLELQSVKFGLNGTSIAVTAKVINRGFAAPQNPRTFYFVLLDENNQVLQRIPSNVDWRNWQPDDFATGIDNQEDPIGPSVNYPSTPANSVGDIKVGGIPLGDFNDGTDPQNEPWHHTPLGVAYTPIDHFFGPVSDFNLSGLADGNYRVGIWAPDPEVILEDVSQYSVKFANQLSYIHSLGVSVVGRFTKAQGTVVPSDDLDGDGMPNANDPTPNNPVEYNGAVHIDPSKSSFGFDSPASLEACGGIYSEGDKESAKKSNWTNNSNEMELLISPNPAGNAVFLNLSGNVKVYNAGQQLVFEADYEMNRPLNTKQLSPGVYFVRLTDEQGQEFTTKFIKM